MAARSAVREVLARMTRREQGFVLAAGSAALLFAAFTFLVGPQLDRARVFERELARQHAERQELQAEPPRARHRSGGAPFVAPENVAGLVAKILEGRRGVGLVSLKTLPPVRLGADGWRHGLELTVRGRHADLADCVAALEQLPVGWERIAVKFDGGGEAILSAELFTASAERRWLAL